jgi:hypothetical protein
MLQVKIDWKLAYGCMHYNPRTAIQAIIALGSYILLALWMTFGGAANPTVACEATSACDDLILWKMLLRQARDGISVNQLTYWKPTHIA